MIIIIISYPLTTSLIKSVSENKIMQVNKQNKGKLSIQNSKYLNKLFGHVFPPALIISKNYFLDTLKN
jgi:hypothetical protein